ncbi:MAG: hypothetical protein ACREHC_04990 [Candidatus Levyibacteriota bacterium]
MYDPKQDKIIEVGPLNIATQAASTRPANNEQSPTVTPTQYTGAKTK